jgi:hypothetical protein
MHIKAYTYFEAIFRVEQHAEGICWSQVREDPIHDEPTRLEDFLPLCLEKSSLWQWRWQRS